MHTNGTLREATKRASRYEKQLVGMLCGYAPGTGWQDLDPSAFVDRFAREAYLAARRIAAERREVNAVTVHEELEGTEEPPGGWASWIADAMELAEKAGRTVYETVTKIREEQARVRLYTGIATQAGSILKPRVPVTSAIGKLTETIRSSGVTSRGVSDLRALLRERAEGTAEAPAAVGELGFPTLDEVTGGIRTGSLYVLAARPGVGKTAMAIQAAIMSVRNTRFDVLFLTAEQPPEELADRFTAWTSGVDLRRIRLGQAAPHGEVLQLPETARIHICDIAGSTTESVVGTIESEVATGRLGLVIVDYMQLIACRDRRKSRYEHVTEVSHALKRTAMSLRVGVLALAQLSRGSERRADQIPRLHDLRDSGAIEQDADAVCMVYRAGLHGSGHIRHLLVADLQKNRHGPLATTLLGFDQPRGRLYEIQPEFSDCPF